MIHINTLENGLTIACQHVPTVETVALCLSVPTGSRHDPQDKSGLAHFLEHMFFKGTVHNDARAIAQKIESCGGYLNAYTAKESTVFFARCLAQYSEHMLEILNDILLYSTFPEAELRKEQNVILQELFMTYDNPEELIFDLAHVTAFQNQGIGQPILGTQDSIKSFNRQDLLNFFQKSYRARDMIFCGVGQIQQGRCAALSQKYLGSLSPSFSPNTPSKAFYTGGFYAQNKALEQNHIILGFEGAPYGSEDYYTLVIVSVLLGGGLSSRLFQKIREDLGLVYSIYAYHTGFMDSGFFGIYASMEPKNAPEVIAHTYEELYVLKSTLEDAELKQAKQQLKTSIMMGLESIHGQCEYLVHQLRIYGRALSRAEIMDRIESISLETVKRKLHTLCQSPYTCAALGPKAESLQGIVEKSCLSKAA